MCVKDLCFSCVPRLRPPAAPFLLMIFKKLIVELCSDLTSPVFSVLHLTKDASMLLITLVNVCTALVLGI